MTEHIPTPTKQIGEEHGEPMGFRVLPDEGKGQWIEISARSQGKFLGEKSTNLLTYKFTSKPDGSLVGEGQGFVYLDDGSTASWVATGEGTQKGGPGGPQSWKVVTHFRNGTGKYATVMGRPIYAEYEVDQAWKSQARIFDTK
jgi:hypothetical protein